METANNFYLFLEYCDQGDLSNFIRKRSSLEKYENPRNRDVSKTHFLNELEASYVVRDIVQGLAHLTEKCGIMHRDIKLDNILVKTRRSYRDVIHSPNTSPAGKLRDLPIDAFEFKLGDLGLAKSKVQQ